MSQANVNLLRRSYDAFARGDIASVLEFMTDDIQFVVAENTPYYRGAPYVGKHEVGEKVFGRAGAEWDGYRIDAEKFHDAGDVIVMQGRYRGTYKATGRTIGAQVAHIWTLRDGKLAKLEQYVDTAAMRDVVAGATAAVTT